MTNLHLFLPVVVVVSIAGCSGGGQPGGPNDMTLLPSGSADLSGLAGMPGTALDASTTGGADMTTIGHASTDMASTSPANGCGQLLGDTPVIFCETFDAPAGNGTRSGDLDGNVWGVARSTGDGTNLGQHWYDLWNPTLIEKCDGTTPRVSAPNDVIICNGQLREAENDNNSGGFDDGTVITKAMYPKQPFDFAGRTGTVSFDVSDDAGPHGAWPELWVSDLPVPAPFNHTDSWQTMPANGLGVRFDSVAPIGMQGECPNGNNLDKLRVTVDSAVAVRNFVLDDSLGFGTGQVKLQILDCVIESNGPGQMNHFELRINTNQIDVYGTDAGVVPTKETLRHIAVITDLGLTLTRGLVWIEDVHYNGDKILDLTRASQREHTFSWDNLAFDGPFTARDFAYDAPDATTPGPNGATNLGQLSNPNQFSTWNVPGLPTSPKPGAVRVLFNFTDAGTGNPTVLNVQVNGHAHSVPWPYPDELETIVRTYAITVPVTDLVAGTNVVKLGSDQYDVVSNVDIVLADVPGGVAVLPGADRAYPK